MLGVQFWVALFPIGSDGKPNVTSFFQNYLGVFVILLFYVCHKVYSRNWKFYIKLSEIDLDTGRRETDVDLMNYEMEEDTIKEGVPMYLRLWRN